MAEGFYKHTRHIGGRGAFAAVRLAVEEASPPTSVTFTGIRPSAMHYISAARTGIAFAHEQLIDERQNPPSVHVTILEIAESFVDTNIILVVYAACNAYCDAMRMSFKRPIDFDFENRCIIFPLGVSPEEYQLRENLSPS